MVAKPRYFRVNIGKLWGIFDCPGYHETSSNIKIDSKLSILYIIMGSRRFEPWTALEWEELQVELERYVGKGM